uniref:dihydropyrimidinase n=1 Tax=Lygus hesperus TaxID=30085 RepID=A0A0A9W645_LYGHE
MSTPVKKVPIHLQSSQNRLLLKHGKVVNAEGVKDADVYIEDGIIKELGKNLIIPGGTRILDVRGMYVMPGGIDPHTHLEADSVTGQKASDDFYQGTRAAIAGGTTMIMDFVIPEKEESLIEAYEKVRAAADPKVCCDYALHICVSQWSDKVQEEMEELCSDRGINSFKMHMAFKDLFQLSDSELYSAFSKCKDLGAVPMVHAENGDIIDENIKVLLDKGITGPEGHDLSRPEIVEAEAVNRACVIANQL